MKGLVQGGGEPISSFEGASLGKGLPAGYAEMITIWYYNERT